MLSAIANANETVGHAIPHMARGQLNELLIQLNQIEQWAMATRHIVAEAINKCAADEAWERVPSRKEEVDQTHSTETLTIERDGDHWYLVVAGERYGPFHAKAAAREHFRKHFQSAKKRTVLDPHDEQTLAV